MTSRRYVQLDVFADRPGAGNPLAVVLDAAGLDDTTMQAIARWTRLPETTFVFPSTKAEASYGIRIFSPRREVPFAGHPSVGTAHAVLEAGLASPRDGLLVQDGIAGLLPLRVIGAGATRTIAVRTPRAKVMEIARPEDARLREVLGDLPLGDLPPALMDGGRRWWLAELRDEATLRAATPPWEAIGKLARDTESMGMCVFARSDDPVYFLAVRAWVGAPAQFEDAASGAANATLAAWLASQDALPGNDGRYRI
ncbi:MAG: PhzF family phenazine biosynthesis protein, partial [Pseudoxanthomonas sp.]